MTGQASQQERRAEVRRGACADRISWLRDQATRTHTGWINDVAASSIAFVTPTRDKPSPGEAVELTFGTGSRAPQRRWVRVTSTVPYDRFFSLIGCRDEPPKERAPQA